MKTDILAKSIKPLIRLNSVDYLGNEKILSPAWTVHSDVIETNPETAVRWTQSDVDGAEFGIKVTQ